MKSHPLPSLERLKQVLAYSPDTGAFVWLQTLSNANRVGNIAGGRGSKGYIHISIDGMRYPASRLAWLYMTAQDPSDSEVDHINRIRDDNRFCNLRLADRATNCRNINKPRHNTSGVTGVSRRASNGRWEAYIHINKRHKHLGTFDDLASAVAARVAAEAQFFGITAQAQQEGGR